MSAAVANMWFWAGDDFVCIKISGRAGVNSSLDFKALINHLAKQGHARFVLDLAECVLMDSTFLGVLVHMGANGAGSNHQCAIELLNPQQRIRDLLDNLGVAELFKVSESLSAAAGNLTPVAHAPDNADHLQLARTSLEAHQALMKQNPANVPKFKDVAQFLREDLQRMEHPGADASPAPDEDKPHPSD